MQKNFINERRLQKSHNAIFTYSKSNVNFFAA